MKQEESLFSDIKIIPPDPIFGINDEYLADPRKDKIALVVGVSLEEDGALPKVMSSVKRAEEILLQKETTKNYLPIGGDNAYIEATKKFLTLNEWPVFGAATLGGTGALRILGDLLYSHVSKHISVPEPTWENHVNLFKRIGFHVDTYPYGETKLDFDKIKDRINLLPEGSIMLLHAMCHNPTGIDFSETMWSELREVMRRKRLFPFFDSAYQGFGIGVKEDALPMRKFAEEGFEFVVAHSFSKSAALYGERVGALFVVFKNRGDFDRIKSNIWPLIRTSYSNPPRHGTSVMREIFESETLFSLWQKELNQLRERLRRNRFKLADHLSSKYQYIREGHGFFTMLGLKKEAVMRLKQEEGIYMTAKSRINLAAINDRNFDRIVQAIKKVSKT